MRPWQFNILFGVAVLGALFLLFGKTIGLDVETNPTALTGYGAILTYVLTQRGQWTNEPKREPPPTPPPPPLEERPGEST